MRGLAAQGVARRTQRRVAESAQLRRHRASRPRPVPLGLERRRSVRDPRARRTRWPRLCRGGGVLAWRQSRDEAGRRASAGDAAVTRGGVRRFARSSSLPSACARSSCDRTSSTSGTSCATSRRACGGRHSRYPGAFAVAPTGAHPHRSRRSTRPTPRRTSDFRARPTTTIARRACASSTGSGFRRS